MKRRNLVIAFLSGGLVLGLVGWFGFPSATAQILLALNNSSAGLSQRSVETEIGPIAYLEGGQGETIVLVHGIYSRKEHWVDVARHLVEDYHVVALDLPGFGDNALLPDETYNLQEQQKNLTMVLQELDLDAVHIGANSMGAYVSGLMIAEGSRAVSSIAFIGSPLGVPSPIESDMEKALSKGDIPLLVQSPEEFEARNAWLSPNELEIPSPILTSWRDAELAQVEKNVAIWHAVQDFESIPPLTELALDIPMPSLVIWCEEDRIFHVSGAKELSDRLPNSHLEVLAGCGHVPMIDQPERVAAMYSDFLSTVSD